MFCFWTALLKIPQSISCFILGNSEPVTLGYLTWISPAYLTMWNTCLKHTCALCSLSFEISQDLVIFWFFVSSKDEIKTEDVSAEGPAEDAIEDVDVVGTDQVILAGFPPLRTAVVEVGWMSGQSLLGSHVAAKGVALLWPLSGWEKRDALFPFQLQL